MAGKEKRVSIEFTFLIRAETDQSSCSITCKVYGFPAVSTRKVY